MKKIYLLAFFVLTFLGSNAQMKQFTPYDELPQINESYKPAYSDDMPEWGKMLYQYPINFNKIDRAFIKWEAENKDKKTPLMRYYKIWRKAITPYVTVDGEIETPNIQRIEKNMLQQQRRTLQPKKAPAVGNNSNWTLYGPKETYFLNNGYMEIPDAAPWQVNVYSFDVTDKNPNILYAGTETGFVNKTTDKGQNWTILGRDYPFGGGVTAVAIHPQNLDTVLVGASKYIHRTLDGGNTWTKVYSAAGSLNRIKYDYVNPNNAIACTSKGVYLSNDAGAQWKRVTDEDTWDIEYKPNDNNVVYALTKNSRNKYIVVQSQNGGNSFNTITSFPDTLINESGGLLAVTPAAPNSIWVLLLAKNKNKRPFIYKGTLATNGDWSWRLVHEGSDGAFTSDKLTNGQGYFDVVLEVSPVDANTLFAGTTSLFKSTTGGRFMSPVGGYAGRIPIHPDTQDMKMLANGDTWLSTDGGMSYTSDNFSTYENFKPLNKMLVGSDFWGFHQGWNEDIVVAGRYHNGNTAIADFYQDKALRMGGGEDATGWVIQGKSRHVAFNDLGAGWILPRTAEGAPEGRFQFTKHPNMDGYGALRSNVVMHPYYSGQIYVGQENALWISKDFGATFDKLYEFEGKVRYFDISTQNPNVMYVDIVGKGLYKTSDGGETFEKKASPLGSITGNLRFVISPYDSEVVYATITHGTWDNMRSEVYRTSNGARFWRPWSRFGGETVIKTLAIQPTTEGEDLVYAVVDTYGLNSGSVYYRKASDAKWIKFDNNYPVGMRVNHALPFYRDSKLRVGGGAGVWESPLAEPKFTPIVVPWVEYKEYKTELDTIQFDCHSYLNHTGATWTWSFEPEQPKYISDVHARNPKVLFSKPGKYTVTLSVTQNGTTTSKTVQDMVVVKDPPVLTDCNNPTELPRQLMSVVSIDSEQPGNVGANVLDGNLATIWHTPWGYAETKYPHEIIIDLGDTYSVSELIYYSRGDGDNGTIKDYEIYIAEDLQNWGNSVKSGTFTGTGKSVVEFSATSGRYAKLVAKNEVKGRNWASAAEIRFTGCKLNTSVNNLLSDVTLKAFPVPAENILKIGLPFQNGLNTYDVYMYSSAGQLLYTDKIAQEATEAKIDVVNYPAGNYFVILVDKAGVTYRVRFIKK